MSSALLSGGPDRIVVISHESQLVGAQLLDARRSSLLNCWRADDGVLDRSESRFADRVTPSGTAAPLANLVSDRVSALRLMGLTHVTTKSPAQVSRGVDHVLVVGDRRRPSARTSTNGRRPHLQPGGYGRECDECAVVGRLTRTAAEQHVCQSLKSIGSAGCGRGGSRTKPSSAGRVSQTAGGTVRLGGGGRLGRGSHTCIVMR